MPPAEGGRMEIYMKFNRKQKEIIRKIASGEIQDIYSYMNTFNLLTFAQFKKIEIQQAFFTDSIPKEYYFPVELSPQFSNIETSDTFTQKVNDGLVNPDKYKSFTLSLNYSYGIKHLSWDNEDYNIDFYNGIYIAKSFDDIISFLSLWQYLKSEMLVIELPSDLTDKTLGLFYEKQTLLPSTQPLSQEEKIKGINFENHTYDDRNYSKGIDYKFSTEKCTICKEYLGKKIYPTPELNLYIQRNFKTSEEKTQSSALFAAWLAIFVSVTLPLIPIPQNAESNYLSEMITEINHLEGELTNIKEQASIYNPEAVTKLNEIDQKIEKITDLLDTLELNNEQSSITNEIDNQITQEEQIPN